MRSQFPRFLIDYYWYQVEELLVNEHGVSRDHARIGIKNYRRAMQSVGDIMYHDDAKDAAKAVKEAGYLPLPAAGSAPTP